MSGFCQRPSQHNRRVRPNLRPKGHTLHPLAQRTESRPSVPRESRAPADHMDSTGAPASMPKGPTRPTSIPKNEAVRPPTQRTKLPGLATWIVSPAANGHPRVEGLPQPSHRAAGCRRTPPENQPDESGCWPLNRSNIGPEEAPAAWGGSRHPSGQGKDEMPPSRLTRCRDPQTPVASSPASGACVRSMEPADQRPAKRGCRSAEPHGQASPGCHADSLLRENPRWCLRPGCGLLLPSDLELPPAPRRPSATDEPQPPRISDRSGLRPEGHADPPSIRRTHMTTLPPKGRRPQPSARTDESDHPPTRRTPRPAAMSRMQPPATWAKGQPTAPGLDAASTHPPTAASVRLRARCSPASDAKG